MLTTDRSPAPTLQIDSLLTPQEEARAGEHPTDIDAHTRSIDIEPAEPPQHRHEAWMERY